jgi:hypothetical protein
MSEVQQPDEEQPKEQPPTPLVHSLGYGAGTMLAAGMVDLLAHLGPTGLVVGGIIAYAAARHGPELVEQVRENLPSPASLQAARKTRNAPAKQSGSQSKRTVLDRALGRFPAEEEDTLVVEEPEASPPEPARQTRRRVSEIAHPIHLSPELIVEADDIVGAGINIFGVKGSGKTGAAARLAEQFARLRVSEVLFDLKGDLHSLVTDRHEDGRPFVPHGVIGVRGRAPRGRSVLALGLQVVYDLRTWQTAEQMANSICVVVEDLLETVARTPEGEEPAPCLVFLDEAEYWLPQAQPSYLSVHTYKRLLDAFHTLATMGRSRGLAPVIATQRIAKVNKDIIAQAEMHVFMKAVLDIDLDRYYDYFNKSLVSREQLRGFQAGEAVVCLPDGSQAITRLLERESRHLSHTPHVTAALTRFAGTALRGPVELDGELGAAPTSLAAAGVPSADQATRRVTAPPPEQPALPEQTAHLWQPAKPGPPLPSPNRLGQPIAAVQQPRPVKARLTPELEQALQAWQAGATTARGLADALKERGMQCEKDKAATLIRRLRELGELP